ncbi:hypothetical protein L1987_74655 [Smallanthus sonchifolius]|uniref:Uncharacterized protein n=1 Tax=Smallanthus sonchifolius TaxID=185202 RepID=A0ACB9A3D2_9ASTR|nr:hypothetical protein L1987_74655 [Smallanthus sonchifolius]
MVEVDINHHDDNFSTYHNLTAYLVKGKKSEGFDDMIDFLCRSKIYFTLTVNPSIYIPHMEVFWNTTIYSTEQGIPHITAKVDGKDIIITEATVRKHLKLQDEGAAISYTKNEYMRTFVSIGYNGNQNEYTIEKALIGPPRKFLCHTLLQCISQKRSGWHQVSSTLASAVHGMVTSEGFNFAHLIFEGLRYNLQEGAKQAFFMYPRFLQEVFNNELKDLSKPAQQILTPVLEAQLEHRAPIEASYTRKRKRSKKTPSILVSQSQSQPKSPHSESQNSNENIKRDSQIVRETSLEVPLLGSPPCQDDVPSPTATISKVLIDLAAKVPSPSSSPERVHSGSDNRMNVEGSITTTGPSIDLEDSDNITKSPTMATHSEDVSFETFFTERNPMC